jgi:hypothetical protein
LPNEAALVVAMADAGRPVLVEQRAAIDVFGRAPSAEETGDAADQEHGDRQRRVHPWSCNLKTRTRSTINQDPITPQAMHEAGSDAGDINETKLPDGCLEVRPRKPGRRKTGVLPCGDAGGLPGGCDANPDRENPDRINCARPRCRFRRVERRQILCRARREIRCSRCRRGNSCSETQHFAARPDSRHTGSPTQPLPRREPWPLSRPNVTVRFSWSA